MKPDVVATIVKKSRKTRGTKEEMLVDQSAFKVSLAIRSIRRVKDLARYSPTEANITKILTSLQHEVDEVSKVLSAQTAPTALFSLDS